ncbi:S8 family serine peptidase [Carboxylicivirga mesophila]|uniref:S8 family serine peptidase n=1 Tax=Carboxylicivirga mesophila TaxID=1166478 RepID=A0ABS5KER8_9BACT|nr:S8 family serine peptidase [Carboxylicivirga mesophila]MBS2213476.1 S8 family serine peptidase [Carboxylicivirga mesophila]
MKQKLLLKLHLAVILMAMAVAVGNAQQYVDGKLKGKVRVKLEAASLKSFSKLKSTKNGIETGIVAFDAVSAKVAASGMQRVIPYAPKFEEKYRRYGLNLWYEIEYDTDFDPQEVVNEYEKLGEVSHAEVIREVSLGDAQPAAVFSSSQVNNLPFDDPKLGNQWHYHNDGTVLDGAVAGADINLFEAWKTQTGSSDVVVAIIDGGIDILHEDLKDAVWVNDAELNGENGVDDDGNGYIDDIYGYNFAKDRAEIEPHFHGTHVAGTVGAVNGNGKGVSGIAGGDGINPGVRLMSCQILVNNGNPGGMAEALIYAANNGAVIAQNSWGWPSPDVYEQLVLDAIDYFVAEAGAYQGSPMKGGVAIFAAGNEGVEGNYYPGAYESTVAVAAIDYTNKMASYSSYGEWVDVSAPGGYTGDAEAGGVLSTYPDNSYGFTNGTSMACPHVSGIAALVVSEHGGAGFTADRLKRHLVTSVNDLEPYLTPNQVGKHGSGFIDAAKALKSGSVSNPPAKVTDLLVQTSQDEAKVEWSVVADADDEIGSSYTLYWSKNPFDANTLASAASTVITRYFDSVGDKVEYSLKDLAPNTNYYFAVKAFDRWGNESELSDVQMVATNNGPSLEVLVNEPALAIDVKSNAIVSSTIQLNNNDEGLLKWSSYIGLASTELDEYNLGIYQPVNVSRSFSTNIQASSVESYETVEAPVAMEMDDRLTLKSSASYVYIGEEDVTLTNSAATRFFVEKGFNVTNFWVDLNIDPEYGPATIEFYKGPQIQDAQLITSQNIESEGAYQIAYYLDVEEQVYFEPNNYYWVVVHTPAGNLFPLGLTKEKEEYYSEQCLFSSNGGQTWEFVNDIYGETDDWVWSLTLRSLSAHLGDYITLTPSAGEVSGNSSEALELSVNANNLIDGTYNEHVIFASNDPDNKLVKEKVSIDVDGHDPILKSQSIIDYGNLFIGKTKTLDIQVVNEGYAGYSLSKWQISSDNPDYKVNSVSSHYIPARGEATVRITFTPSVAGAQYANILMNNGSYSHSFKLAGTAVEPAEVTITPATASIGTGLTVGDAVAPVSFDITNTGNYPLSYAIPSFAEGYNVEGLERPINEFGYSYTYALDLGPSYQNLIGIEHGWKDISTATNILDDVKGMDYAVELDLGFSFPFYDRFYDKVWVNEQGVLVFGENGNIRINNGNNTTLSRIREMDMISAAMMDAKFDSQQAAVFYERSEGEFRVHYKYISIGGRSVNLQIVLYANGDFDILFGQVARLNNEKPNYFVGITDKENGQHAFASNSDYPLSFGVTTDYNSHFHFKHPGENMVVNASNAFGTLLPNESATVTLEFDTQNALQGDVFQRVPIVSNDVNNPMSIFEVTANFISGGQAILQLSNDTVDFGDILKTSAAELPLQIINTGTASEDIVSIAFSSADFSTDVVIPYAVNPRQSIYLPIAANTSMAKEATGTATITFEGGTVFEVELLANVKENPVIGVNPSQGFTETVNARSFKDVDVTIANTGLGQLEVSVLPNEWCYPVSTGGQTGEISDYDYSYSMGTGNGWVDILDVAKESNLLEEFWYSGAAKPYIALPLDQPFYYYGQEYNTIYIGAMGWITFIEPVDVTNVFEMPREFPAEDKFVGALAPMVGPHNNAPRTTYEKTGIYYHRFEDVFVVTFHQFVDLTGAMSKPYSFQIVLHDNGRIDFNYRHFDSVKVYGIIGIESPDEKEGLVMHHELFNGSYEPFSYSIFPIKKEVVEPQSEKVVTMRLDTKNLYDGNYYYDLPIANNSVDAPNVQLPVNLTVVGQPDITVENITSEVWYVQDSVYVEGFKIRNEGTKAIQLASSTTTADSDLKVEFYYPANGNMVSGYPEGYVALDDFIGKQLYANLFMGQLLIEDGAILEPGEEWQCFVTYSPAQVGSSSASSMIYDIDGNVAVTWSASMTSLLPPVATLGDDVIVMADNPTHQEVRQLAVANTNGSSTLEWSAKLRFSRGEEAPEEAYATPMATVASDVLKAALAQDAAVAGTAGLKATTAYNRTLKHTDKEEVENWLGFGFANAFISATKFTVPDDGFLLSHVETWYRHESQSTGTLYVEILAGGTSIEHASIVGQGSLKYEEEGYGDVGKFQTIALDEPVYLYPGEDFYVVIKYPLGVSNPQGKINDYANATEGRYFFQYEGEWSDIYATQFYDNAFLVRVHEFEFKEMTWLKLAQKQGTVEAGQTFDLDITFDAAYSQEYVNKAEIVITTNDPVTKELSADLYLLMNKGPHFEHIEGNKMIEENTTSTLKFSVKDMEQDSYTVILEAAADWMQMTTNEGGVVEITMTPDYFAQGLHDIQLVGTDEHGEQTSFTYPIEVININRDPYFTYGELKDTVMVLEHGAHEIPFEELIADYDMDEMSYNVSLSNEEIIDLFVGESGIVLTPFTIGTVDLTISGIDEHGAKLNGSFKITVVNRTGFDSVEDGRIEIYPNPACDYLMVRWNQQNSDAVTIRFMNATGAMVEEVKSNGSEQRINVGHLSKGVYLVEVVSGSESYVTKVIKK